ncbi:hypothetical protein M0805_005110 [Coniferiporia weirii]|nr:hypothetical protein M0805_005110 [Coniferiporia weirii]
MASSPRPLALLSLPNETLSTVLAHLPPGSLVSLVRVSRRLQSISERLLYSDISISDSVDGDPDTIVTPYQTQGCCTAVRRRPHLASSIRRILIRWSRDRARQHHECRFAPGVLRGLHDLLLAAAQIDVLELHLAGLPAGYDYAELLGGTAFHLRRLALSGPVDGPVEWFLRVQPGVVHLQLGDHRRPLVLAPHDLPLLESFRGDARCAASVLPGRPVSGLALSGYEPSEELLVAFAYSKLPIRRLDLSGLSVTPTQLLTISKHLTALETLRMRLALRHTLHFTFSGMMLLSALTQVLGAFQSLAHLDLSPTNVDGIVGVHNEVEEHSLCTVWAGVCPSLQRVNFPSGSEWARATPDGIWRPTSSVRR